VRPLREPRIRTLLWLTPVLGLLLGVGIWLVVKEEPSLEVSTMPSAPRSTRESAPAVSADEGGQAGGPARQSKP
jgi:cytochrome c-type biogenesis protein CcmH/NrfF